MLFHCSAEEDSWARRSNQSILKKINPQYSLEGLMVKLKFQYFGYLMQRADSLEKTLMLGKMKAKGEEDGRGWDGWIASPIQQTWTWANSRRWWGMGKPGMLQSMKLQRVGHDLATKRQQIQYPSSMLSSWQITCYVNIDLVVKGIIVKLLFFLLLSNYINL